MRGSITINDKEIGLVANAASPYLFRQTFHEDFIQQIQEGSQDIQLELFTKMCFIMAKQAETTDFKALSQLNEKEFYEWLTMFDAMDIALEIPKIMDIYFANAITTSAPKKRAD